jgi:hypothetical protein
MIATAPGTKHASDQRISRAVPHCVETWVEGRGMTRIEVFSRKPELGPGVGTEVVSHVRTLEGALIVNSGPVRHAARRDVTVSWWFDSEAIVVAVPSPSGF